MVTVKIDELVGTNFDSCVAVLNRRRIMARDMRNCLTYQIHSIKTNHERHHTQQDCTGGGNKNSTQSTGIYQKSMQHSNHL